jgi:hypothetical protein
LVSGRKARADDGVMDREEIAAAVDRLMRRHTVGAEDRFEESGAAEGCSSRCV